MALLALGAAGVWAWIAGPSKAKPAQSWLPAFGLVLTVGLAVAGVLMRLPGLFMLLAATLALAGWDLALYLACSTGEVPASYSRRLDQRHLQSLGLAVLVGLLASGLSQALSLKIPFGVMVALVIVSMICLDRLILIVKAGNSA